MADKTIDTMNSILEPMKEKFAPDAAWSYQHNTPLPKEKQGEFSKWIAEQSGKGKNPLKDMEDYDVQGYFLSGAATDERGHGTDKFKKPNHPTFSDESMYHGDKAQGGKWTEIGGKSYFLASPDNLKYRSAKELKEYFKKYEPDTILILPK